MAHCGVSPAGPGGSEPSESEKAAEAALEAAIRRTGYTSSPAAPKPVDHYAILGLAHDFTPAELKRRYKKASLAAHPDRAGGSTEAFEAVAAAYEVLGDEKKRAACECSTHKSVSAVPLHLSSTEHTVAPLRACCASVSRRYRRRYPA